MNKTGESIPIYLKTDLIYKIRNDLTISGRDNFIGTEMISNESKNMLLSYCYRPPKGIMENLTAYITSKFQRVLQYKKFLPQSVWAWVYSSYQQAYKGL